MSKKRNQILDLATRYQYAQAHSHQVECLAGTLFVELEAIHNLNREDRKLLEYAAILHDIGSFLSSQSHHKHSLQLIMMEPLPEFTLPEKLMIANIARYHRKVWPSEKHTTYAVLTERERNKVNLLAPLLRLADALDKSHQNVVQELTCDVNPSTGSVTVSISTTDDASREIESFRSRCELFTASYHREIILLPKAANSRGAENVQVQTVKVAN